jgi:hypothetical protein
MNNSVDIQRNKKYPDFSSRFYECHYNRGTHQLYIHLYVYENTLLLLLTCKIEHPRRWRNCIQNMTDD